MAGSMLRVVMRLRDKCAPVAQMEEHWTPNLDGGGSSPPGGAK